MNFLEKVSNYIARKLYWVAGAAIVAMMLITCADVSLRYFRLGVPGTYELVCLLGSVAAAFALAHTCREGAHVAVSLIIRYFPERIQDIIGTFTNALSVIFFFIVSWQSVLYGNELRITKEVSLALQLPLHPFVYGIAFGALAITLLLFSDLLKSIKGVCGK